MVGGKFAYSIDAQGNKYKTVGVSVGKSFMPVSTAHSETTFAVAEEDKKDLSKLVEGTSVGVSGGFYGGYGVNYGSKGISTTQTLGTGVEGTVEYTVKIKTVEEAREDDKKENRTIEEVDGEFPQ